MQDLTSKEELSLLLEDFTLPRMRRDIDQHYNVLWLLRNITIHPLNKTQKTLSRVLQLLREVEHNG